jgi:hypothetical protein
MAPSVVRPKVVAPVAPTTPRVVTPASTVSPPPPRQPPRAPRAPRAPPTVEAIAALAQKERVPNRIAKGELMGKMKCRIWKKLHAEEAKRFAEAWALAESTPGLDIAEAFGLVQSGMSLEEWRQRRARAKRREAIKQARATVAPEPIDAFIAERITEKTEMAFVFAERTALDILTQVAPVSFSTERAGDVEKIQVVALARKNTWDALLPQVQRDPRLSHKPLGVARQPSRRPVSDPRDFLSHQGEAITVSLRNGMKVTLPLLSIGPFDVLMGEVGAEVFIPLHAMLSWGPT